MEGNFLVKRVLLAFLLFLSSMVNAHAFLVEISENELQQKIEKLMPYEAKKYSVSARFSNPTIKLGPNENVMHITSNVNLSGLSETEKTGVVTMRGTLHYDQKSSSVFLKNVIIEDIETIDIQESNLPKIKLITQLIAVGFFSIKPVYTIKNVSFKSSIAKTFLTSINVTSGKLILDF